jgi:adenylate kinase
MKPHLIILGAPGSGKGTQASLLAEKGYKHISTGELLRSEIAKNSDLGIKVSEIMSSGSLVDDNTVLALLKANCILDEFSYIFDGFPRNLFQAEMLEIELLNGRNYKVIYFKIDMDVLVERLVNRRTCESCGEIYNLATKIPTIPDVCDKCGSIGVLKQRRDDTSEVVTNRLKIFTDTIEPMLSFYRSKKVLVEINASLCEKEVFKILEKIIC